MSLTIILLLTILLCGLISGVQTHESRTAQGGALGLLLLAAFELWLRRGGLGDFWGREPVEQALPILLLLLSLLTTFKSRERTLSLVLVFASLLHFFIAVGVIDKL